MPEPPENSTSKPAMTFQERIAMDKWQNTDQGPDLLQCFKSVNPQIGIEKPQADFLSHTEVTGRGDQRPQFFCPKPRPLPLFYSSCSEDRGTLLSPLGRHAADAPGIDQATATVLKRKLGQDFYDQLMVGIPTGQSNPSTSTDDLARFQVDRRRQASTLRTYELADPLGRRTLPKSHFAEPACQSRRVGGGPGECRVRLPDGSLEEVVLSREESSLIVPRAEVTNTAPFQSPAPTDLHPLSNLPRIRPRLRPRSPVRGQLIWDSHITAPN